jgi:hypothetical protein
MDLRRLTPTTRTLLAVFVESRPPPEALTGAGPTVPTFTEPGRAARALGRVVAYDESRRREAGGVPEFGDFDAAAVRRDRRPLGPGEVRPLR